MLSLQKHSLWIMEGPHLYPCFKIHIFWKVERSRVILSFCMQSAMQGCSSIVSQDMAVLTYRPFPMFTTYFVMKL